MLSNVAKQNVTRFPYEIARYAQDIAGGLIVTMPSEKELANNVTGPLVRKFMQTKDGVDIVDRMRIMRLIENMTIGRNAVGYLTESLHGAGSPQAQRIEIGRGAEYERKKGLALYLAGVNTDRKAGAGSKLPVGRDVPPVLIAHVPMAVSHEVEMTHAWVGGSADD
jgi:4-hydroxybutyryl-CoA dehydratase/vinylacetyl-CoA-Delta-isomerase